MKVPGDTRPNGILIGTSKTKPGGWHKEIFLNFNNKGSKTEAFKVYDSHWSNSGNFWYIVGSDNLVEWDE